MFTPPPPDQQPLPPPIAPLLPKLTPDDGYSTATSVLQHETEEILLKHLPQNPIHAHAQSPAASVASASERGKEGKKHPPVPSKVLNKHAHMQFLVRNLMHGFGSRYTSQDASQPWLMYWTLQSFGALGVVLDPLNKQRVIDKILKWQHPGGGFGGGPGQAAHLLTTYASVCALAIVGRPGPGGGWDDIDRQALYKFFLSLKQPDGSFLVAHHAEVDVRGIYCLLIVATLLDILTPALVEDTAEFIASCQTYEGGFASSSFPSYDAAQKLLRGAPRPPLGEAHGGYTFCALASWVLLKPYVDLALGGKEGEAEGGGRPEIDLGTLTRWLVQMQGGESELGGFKGRTNKLVDGCYAWWCAGAFGLLEALGVGVDETRGVELVVDPWGVPLGKSASGSVAGSVKTGSVDGSVKTGSVAGSVKSNGPGEGSVKSSAKSCDGKVAGAVDGTEAGGADLPTEGEGSAAEPGEPHADAQSARDPWGQPAAGWGKESTGWGGWGQQPGWVDVDDGLFNSKALQEYLLYAGQSPSGGLRDKPPKPADAYHTHYCLSGLSSAQHHISPSASKKTTLLQKWDAAESGGTRGRKSDLGVSERDREVDQAMRREALGALLSWVEDPVVNADQIVGGKENKLNATHPITNLTVTHTEGVIKWAYGI
ncbi:terpenoid cyclases/Protein prenyltransferase [Coprinopsis marcescibilis]|uniref:Terpenoid cyclases/Protein prenyltransferase n=1 Tax=Coprinopsis marcescibilis TaxID=230819 RepID=A0A5C3KMT5_COPMA|nr:terpenoid cyclases/Protein prenyltransferase [Coprinopsis marcescibilis]